MSVIDSSLEGWQTKLKCTVLRRSAGLADSFHCTCKVCAFCGVRGCSAVRKPIMPENINLSQYWSACYCRLSAVQFSAQDAKLFRGRRCMNIQPWILIHAPTQCFLNKGYRIRLPSKFILLVLFPVSRPISFKYFTKIRHSFLSIPANIYINWRSEVK